MNINNLIQYRLNCIANLTREVVRLGTVYITGLVAPFQLHRSTKLLEEVHLPLQMCAKEESKVQPVGASSIITLVNKYESN